MHPDDLNAIRSVLEHNSSIVFAFLYGSSQVSDLYNDIDIAVYSKDNPPPPGLSVDLQIALSAKTGKAPDQFYVRVINRLLQKGDLFALLYLNDVLNRGRLLIDNDFQQRLRHFLKIFDRLDTQAYGHLLFQSSGMRILLASHS
jgi:predicted nucleotidyltransferase